MTIKISDMFFVYATTAGLIILLVGDTVLLTYKTDSFTPWVYYLGFLCIYMNWEE